MVYFHNNEDDGVLSEAVDNGGDEVFVALKTNGTAEWRPVYTLIESDGGTTQTALR